MSAKFDVLAQVARIDRDIEALTAKIREKQEQRNLLLTEAQQALSALLPHTNGRLATRTATDYTGRKRGPAKGTPNRHQRSLTPEQVRSIRSRFKAGESQSALAREFNLSQPNISSIVHRRSYADVK